MTIDYHARKQPAVYKPLIDAALDRIAKVGGRTFTPPESIAPGTGPWGYLTTAVAVGKDDLTTGAVRAMLGEYHWSYRFLLGRLAEHLTAFETVETEEDAQGGDDDEDWDPDGRPIVLAYYPEEARACLRQENFVGGADADVFALWERDDRTSVCHAHMEGFWILGEDPVDYIERIAARAEGQA